MDITKIITTEYDVTNVPMLRAGEVCPVTTYLSPKRYVAGSEILDQLCRVDQFRKRLSEVESGMLKVLGHDEPPISEQELEEEIKNSYHPGKPVRYQPQPTSLTWLEEKLAEAEEVIRQRDSQLAAMEKLVQEMEGRHEQATKSLDAEYEANQYGRQELERLRGYIKSFKQQISQQGSNIEAYRNQLKHAEQELDHLRNVCAEHEAACRQPIANILGVYNDMANTGPMTDEEYTRRELGELRVQLTHLLKEAKRD